MAKIFLTKDHIIDSYGSDQFEKIIELEILFTTFDEFASLENCTNLKKLSCIDNGLKRITNLNPISNTLVCLCLCDQSITSMDLLTLPNLKELYLHRNEITSIGNLNGCPRLRKLWLFQNKISSITNLQAIPELEDLWLQANQINKLAGLEHNNNLKFLGMAGNPIKEFKEVKRLQSCASLRSISFTDIHFGKSPIADENGYKEFILLQLRQIQTLDGVTVNKDSQLHAEDIYYAQLKSFNASLQEVEQSYRNDLKAIEAQHQYRESHSMVLEKEMSAALKELQGLVNEGRSVISKQVTYNQNLITVNTNTLAKQLQHLEEQATEALKLNLDLVHNEFDISSSLLCLFDQISSADSEIITALSEVSSVVNNNQTKILMAQKATNDVSKEDHFKSVLLPYQKVYFQIVSNNSADFQYLSSLVSSSTTTMPSQDTMLKNNNNTMNSNNILAHGMELVKLYRIICHLNPSTIDPTIPNTTNTTNTIINANSNSTNSNSNSNNNSISVIGGGDYFERVFTILSPEALKVVLIHGWGKLSSYSNIVSSTILSSDPDLIATLYDSVSITMSQSISEQYLNLLQSDIVDDNMLLNLIKSDNSNTTTTNNNNNNNISNNKKILEQSHKYQKLQEAVNTKICRFYHDKVNFPSKDINEIVLPVDDTQKRDLMLEFQKAKRPQKILFQSKAATNNSSKDIFILPTTYCIDSLVIDYAALCITPPLGGGGMRTIDCRLEPLLLPTVNIDSTAHILSTYEQQAAVEINLYMDKILEEVDDKHANILKTYEQDVSTGEHSMKTSREEVEKERKNQEMYLKEMRQVHEGGSGLAHNNSSNNLQANNYTGRNSKR